MGMDVNVAVVMGDPRLAYSYGAEGKFGQDELEAARQLKAALPAIEGYQCTILDDHSTLIGDLQALRPDLALNFCDTGFRNDWYRTSNIPALLEVLDIPYTGATPAGIALSDDKALTYAAASLRGVPVPRQLFIDLSQQAPCLPDFFPALLKPNVGMGSFGVTETSIVYSPEEARAQLERLRPDLAVKEVIAQEFLSGAEYTVGLLGNEEDGFTLLPPLEVDFSELDPALPRLLTYGSKAQPDSPYWKSLRFRRASLAPDTADEIAQHCRRIFSRIGLRDYARFDFRCDARGRPYLIDANCNPTWYANGKMAMMASWLGHEYPAFVRMILDSACSRYGLGDKS
jgi:D-alanine-D-alanine ligase